LKKKKDLYCTKEDVEMLSVYILLAVQLWNIQNFYSAEENLACRITLCNCSIQM